MLFKNRISFSITDNITSRTYKHIKVIFQENSARDTKQISLFTSTATFSVTGIKTMLKFKKQTYNVNIRVLNISHGLNKLIIIIA